MKVGIVGFGYVGQAMYHVISKHVDIVLYDKFIPELNQFSRLINSEIIFIALPTPNQEAGMGQDLSALTQFLNLLEASKLEPENLGWNPLIVIKSTMTLSGINPYLGKYNIVVNPEFLNQNTSFEDAESQDVLVMGGRIDLLKQLENFYKMHTTLEHFSCELMTIEEAINFKYIRNIYGAYKVLFWNWVQEQTGNSRKYADLYGRMPQGEMSQVAADGKLGYGGACFTKDVEARHIEFPHELTDFMQTYNSSLRGTDIRDFNFEINISEDLIDKNIENSIIK